MALNDFRKHSRHLFFPLFVIGIIFANCTNRRRLKIEYYPGTTILKSEGYYINDKPVDTIKNFSKDGWLESIKVYSKEGLLNGKSITLYENGKPSEIVSYRNGNITGRYLSFRENGTKKLIGFYLDGRAIGDAYFFDTLDRLHDYNFFDFNKDPIIYCKYDSNGKIILDKNAHLYFIDSVQLSKSLNDADTVKILLLISHQPKISMKITIDNVDKNGRIMHSHAIDEDEQLIYYNDLISKEVDTIKVIGARYDSVLGISKKVGIIRAVKDLE